MKVLWGLVRLGLGSAAGSRLLLTMGLLTMAAAIGMPLTVSGDGTPAGDFRVLQTYALGTVWLLLAVSTIWACGAFISGEIEDRTLRMVMVRPVRAWQVWLGKWLAVLLINTVLLAASGVAVYAMGQRMLNQRLAPHDSPDQELRQEIRTSWLALPPRQVPLDDDIAAMLAQWEAQGILTDDPDTRRRAERAARRDVLARRSTAEPGTELAWSFPPSAARRRLLQRPPPLKLRFAYTTSPFDRQFVSGTWRITVPPDTVIELDSEALFDGRHTVELPDSIRAVLLATDAPLAVTFRNAPAGSSIAVMFDVAAPVELLAPVGSLAGNLLRILLIMLGITGTLAAIGLTAGALFSSPVALFVSTGLLMAFAIANSRVAHELESVRPPPGPVASVLHRGGGQLLRSVRMLSEPAFRLNPLQSLSEGIALPWPAVWRALAVLLVAYPLLFGLLGSAVLARRQLAT